MKITWFEHVDVDGNEFGSWVEREEQVEPREAAILRIAELFGSAGFGPNREGFTAVHSDTLELLTPGELQVVGAA